MDCEAMCGLMSCDMKCMNVLCVNSSPLNVLCGQFFLKVNTSLKEKKTIFEACFYDFERFKVPTNYLLVD